MAASTPRWTKFVLGEDRIPRSWYNITADLPTPPPPVLHPGTGQPIGPADLAPLFPMGLIQQLVSPERYIEIPDEVRDVYALYRPSPLFRARRLEQALDTPAHIYYKYEGGSPSGSHKPNTAIAQAYYNKMEGVTRLATETGAGQWGSALAFAGAAFGLDVKVYMVRASYDQKPYRRLLMETYGSQVAPSPSSDTEYGRKVLAETPNHTGSLGLAISEAIEDTVTHPGTKYSLGSVFDFVLLHQTVIGEESIEQMAMAGEEPDVIIACAGGGSNFAGLAFPWLGRMFREGKRFHPGADPRRWAAIPRDGAAGQPRQGGWFHRGHRHSPASDLRRWGSIRSDGGDPAGARADARHQGRDRRSTRGEGGRRSAGNPLQPVRTRPLRPVGVRTVPGGVPRGLRVPRREGPGGARGAAEDLA
jgi:predicted alternative tryptophan synthase beta-subunit